MKRKKWFGEAKYAWYCLLVLFSVGLLRELDTWALPTLQTSGLQCSSCGDDEDVCDGCLNLSDVDMGFLNGPAFTFSSLLVLLPLGWLADHYSRVWILASGLFLWSVSTIAGAFAQEFWHLAITRIFLGFGSAAVNPCVYGILSDYFTPANRAMILALFSGTIYLGQLLGLLTSYVSQLLSWRAAFIILGIPGLITTGVLLFTIKEPIRGMSESRLGKKDVEEKGNENEEETSQERPKISFIAAMRCLIKMPAFVAVLVAGSVRNFGGWGMGGWLQVFLVRTHGLSPSEYIPWLLVIIPLGGSLGALFGGILADRWAKRTFAGKALLIATSQFVASGLVVLFLLVPNPFASLTLLFPAYIFAEMWYGPAAAIVQDVAPPTLRGLATSIYFVVSSLGALSPLLIGWLNELFAIDTSASSSSSNEKWDPRWSMLIVIGSSYLCASIGFAITAWFLLGHRRRLQELLSLSSRSGGFKELKFANVH